LLTAAPNGAGSTALWLDSPSWERPSAAEAKSTHTHTLYQLLESIAFVRPVSPGDTPVYPAFAPPVAIKSINNVFKRSRRYYLLYMNINQACFQMLDKTVPNRYKVLNNPNLTGWNSPMSICSINNQLRKNYGMSNPMVLFNNNTLF
jgi:hypothetical protein